jgi:preprotein translocase subunit SecD
LGRSERKSLNVDNPAEHDPSRSQRWEEAAAARARCEALLLPHSEGATLLFSRKCQDNRLAEDDRANKKVDYFFLVRDPEKGKAITGGNLYTVSETVDRMSRPAVAFRLNNQGGDLFFELTAKNSPTGPEDNRFYRHLAIILDGQIESAPRLISAIHSEGQITGNFTSKEVQNLVRILRAGALPARLKPLPVGEIHVEPGTTPHTP